MEKEEEKNREGGLRGKEEGRRSNLFSTRIRVGHYMLGGGGGADDGDDE